MTLTHTCASYKLDKTLYSTKTISYSPRHMSHQSEFNGLEFLHLRPSMIGCFALLTLVILATASTGCRTAAGFGEDLQAAGEAIEETSEDIRDSIE